MLFFDGYPFTRVRDNRRPDSAPKIRSACSMTFVTITCYNDVVMTYDNDHNHTRKIKPSE